MGTNHSLANKVSCREKVQRRFCSHYLLTRSRGSSLLPAPRSTHPIPRLVISAIKGEVKITRADKIGPSCLLGYPIRTQDRFILPDFGLNRQNNENYDSFKIFRRFWLAKSTHIIHHNQFPETKFGRILCLKTKWRQKCSVRAGYGTVNREDLGRRLSCFSCVNKKWRTFHSFQE